MGDYLNHLTGRVSGVQAAVRPRLPSWFEPPRGLAATRLSYIFPARRAEREEAAPIEDFSSTIAASTPQVPAKEEKPATVTPAIIFSQHDQRPHKPDPQPASLQPATESPRTVRTRHIPEPAREEKKEREERDDGAKQSLRAAAQGLRPSSSEEADSVRLRPEIKKPITRRPDRDANATQQETLSPAPQRRRVESAKEIVPAAHKHTIEKVLAQPAPVRPAENIQNVSNLSPVRAARQTPAITRAEPLQDSSPAVQVVIGRVIVQAIAPPPAPVLQAPRQQVPRLSLEEYLKQREGPA